MVHAYTTVRLPGVRARACARACELEGGGGASSPKTTAAACSSRGEWYAITSFSTFVACRFRKPRLNDTGGSRSIHRFFCDRPPSPSPLPRCKGAHTCVHHPIPLRPFAGTERRVVYHPRISGKELRYVYWWYSLGAAMIFAQFSVPGFFAETLSRKHLSFFRKEDWFRPHISTFPTFRFHHNLREYVSSCFGRVCFFGGAVPSTSKFRNGKGSGHARASCLRARRGPACGKTAPR